LPTTADAYPASMTRKYLYSAAAAAVCLASSASAAAVAVEDSPPPVVANLLEMVGRASSTSEVLTLNLTNLIILLILKALILGFGLFAGGGVGGAVGRSAEESMSVTQSDLTGGMCFLMYTSGAEEKLDCLKRTACEDPYVVSDYLTAAKVWYNLSKLPMFSFIPFEEKYTTIFNAMTEASEYGKQGSECSARFNW